MDSQICHYIPILIFIITIYYSSNDKFQKKKGAELFYHADSKIPIYHGFPTDEVDAPPEYQALFHKYKLIGTSKL